MQLAFGGLGYSTSTKMGPGGGVRACEVLGFWVGKELEYTIRAVGPPDSWDQNSRFRRREVNNL